MATSSDPDLPSHQQVKAQAIRKIQPHGPYNITNTSAFFVIELIDSSLKGGPASNGWKVHISIDPTKIGNIEKAWELFLPLAQHHQIGSFKFVNKSNPGIGKQVTIYCDGEEKVNLQEFLIAVSNAFRDEKISPQGGESPDCRKISDYILIRRELLAKLGKSCIPGAPDGYLSDMHVDLARKVIERMKEGHGFELAFNYVTENDQELGGQKFRTTPGLDKKKCQEEISLTVQLAKTYGDNIPWHNLEKAPDRFGLEERDFIIRLSGVSVLEDIKSAHEGLMFQYPIKMLDGQRDEARMLIQKLGSIVSKNQILHKELIEVSSNTEIEMSMMVERDWAVQRLKPMLPGHLEGTVKDFESLITRAENEKDLTRIISSLEKLVGKEQHNEIEMSTLAAKWKQENETANKKKLSL